MTLQPRWEDITREERYFCSFLFHDIRTNSNPFMTLIRDNGLRAAPDTTIVDVGYEVCFFRDVFRVGDGLIERQRALEKQTFDFVLWLSDKSMIIIEAKAQQGFGMDQLKKLSESKSIIANSDYPTSRIHLIGLASSSYSPQDNVNSILAPILTWEEVMNKYPSNARIYARANGVYGK